MPSASELRDAFDRLRVKDPSASGTANAREPDALSLATGQFGRNPMREALVEPDQFQFCKGDCFGLFLRHSLPSGQSESDVV